MTGILPFSRSSRPNRDRCGLAHATLVRLIDQLDASDLERSKIIRWGAPIPYFGDFCSSRVATLGLNPSNREYVDQNGRELDGAYRRFHTLSSLGLNCWSDADADHIQMILESCNSYFCSNPYDRWFRKLDEVVRGAGASFYDSAEPACHLDLIPYATTYKWTELTTSERSRLLDIAVDALGRLLVDSRIELLILNGQAVVDRFQDVIGMKLERKRMAGWDLPRTSIPVAGFAYEGKLEVLCGFSLSQPITVLGYNHNLQSSFGVTSHVIQHIQQWVSDARG